MHTKNQSLIFHVFVNNGYERVPQGMLPAAFNSRHCRIVFSLRMLHGALDPSHRCARARRGDPDVRARSVAPGAARSGRGRPLGHTTLGPETLPPKYSKLRLVFIQAIKTPQTMQ